MEKAPASALRYALGKKAADTKTNPRAQSGVTVPRRKRVGELWFGGGACGCKSGGEPPHSKLGEGNGLDSVAKDLRGGV
jgi:hypothetical protein